MITGKSELFFFTLKSITITNRVRHEIRVSALGFCERKLFRCLFVLFCFVWQYDQAVFTYSCQDLKPWPTDGTQLSVIFSAVSHSDNDARLSDKR